MFAVWKKINFMKLNMKTYNGKLYESFISCFQEERGD